MTDKKAQDYQSLSAELEEVLSVLQSNDLDIDIAVGKYSRGMELIDELEKHLKDAENKITKIQKQWNKAG